MAALTKTDRLVLCDYLRTCADLIELRDWTILLSPEHPDESEAWADITPTYGRKIACLRLCPEFRELPERVIRRTLAHELIHCHLDPAADVIEQGSLSVILGKPGYTMLYDTFRQQLEYACDALADALAPTLPEFSWDNDLVGAAADLWLQDSGDIYVEPARLERPRTHVGPRTTADDRAGVERASSAPEAPGG